MEVVRRLVGFIDNKQYRSIMFAIVLSIISAVVLLKIVDSTFSTSDHPVISLLVFVICGTTFIIPFIVRKKEIFIYYFILSFPCIGFTLKGLTLLQIYSFVLVVIYRKEIVNLVKDKGHIYRIPFFIIIFCFIYTSLLSHHPRAAFERVLFFSSLVGIYFAITTFIKSEREIKTVFRFLLMLFAFCVLVSFLQFRFGVDSIKFSFLQYGENTGASHVLGLKRMPSVFPEAQAAGQYFATMIILSLGCLSTYFRKSRLIKGILVFGALAFLFTITRIAILSFLGVMLIVHLFILPFKRIMIIMLIIFCVTVAGKIIIENIIPSGVSERFDPDEQKKSFDYRFMLWEASFPIFVHHPFGVGLGGENLFDAGCEVNAVFMPEYTETPSKRNNTHFESSYLEILYSLGIIGFFGFMLLLTEYFKTGIKLIKENPHSDVKRFSLYLMGAMAVWLIPAAISPQWNVMQPMIIFVTLLALMNSLNNIYRNTVYEQDKLA